MLRPSDQELPCPSVPLWLPAGPVWRLVWSQLRIGQQRQFHVVAFLVGVAKAWLRIVSLQRGQEAGGPLEAAEVVLVKGLFRRHQPS